MLEMTRINWLFMSSVTGEPTLQSKILSAVFSFLHGRQLASD